MRRALAAIAAATSALSPLGTLGCAEPARNGARPDVLLVTVDTLRADHLSSYGFPLETSPRIDAFAADAVVFERAIAGSSATVPSHASILASRYTRGHSVGYGNGESRLEDVATLAGVFREAGYATGAFVSNFLLQRRIGLDRGFDVYDDDLPSAELNRASYFERIAEQTAARALEWLGEVEGEPFFLWVHFQDPHGPYAPPARYRGRFQVPPAPDERPLPVLDDNSGLAGIPVYQALEGMSLPSVYRSRYADEIYYADHSIGALIEAVDARSSPHGAVVLLTADHGESLGEEGRFFVHAVTTPDVAHVPMILRAPGLLPGRRREVAHHVDVMPTLLELADLDAPVGVRGLALGPFLRGEKPIPKRLVYCDIGAELSAYGGDGFVRVLDVRGAWESEGDAGGHGVAPFWARYTWNADGSWALERVGGGLDDEIRGYLRKAIPMAKAQSAGRDFVERLRALGYTED
jgi:arylsulfatase A-like enzyme